MGWLRLVGSFKLQVSFAEYRPFYRALWQKIPIILWSLLAEATPHPARRWLHFSLKDELSGMTFPFKFYHSIFLPVLLRTDTADSGRRAFNTLEQPSTGRDDAADDIAATTSEVLGWCMWILGGASA